MKVDVINFHFTDNCNYHCHHCFVKKEAKEMSLEKIKKVINEIAEYFSVINEIGRINLVGGEVFCCNYLQDIIDYIYNKNIKVSLVTNGYCLSEKFILDNKNKLDYIGISVDSLVEETNIQIGRCTLNNKTLSKDELIKKCLLIKDNGIKLKINHCISTLNMLEDISTFIEIVKPNRFKIFQMTIIKGINDESESDHISSDLFKEAVKKYKRFNPIIERDIDMKDGYVIIDSMGNLYVNKEEQILGNILNDNLVDLMQCIKINEKAYKLRYQTVKNI